MVQIQQLSYFVAVADKGSINKAAKELFVTQSNLSKAIINLETELNIKTLHRTNKGVTLTEDGKKLYKYAKSVLDQIDLINKISTTEVAKTLSITSYPILVISRLMADFYKSHAGQNITLKITEQRIQKVIESVTTSEAEIGVILINNAQSKELKRLLTFKNLEFTPVAEDTWYANVGKNNPFYNRDEINIRELLPYPVIRFPDDYFSQLTFFLEIDGIQLTEFKHVVHVNNSGAITNMIRETDVFRFGIGVNKKNYEQYDIKTIPITNCDVKVHMGWIKRKNEALTQEAKEFIMRLSGLYK